MRFWKIIFVFFMLLFWGVCIHVFFWGTQGPDARFELDSNHHLMGWPGFVVQYRQDGSSDLLMLNNPQSEEFCPSSISKFAVTDKYIVAQAKEGWLAINRTSLEAWGCYEEIGDLEGEIGERFGNLEMVNEFPRSYIFIPRRTWATMLIISLIFVGIISGVLFFSRKRK